MLPVLYSVSLGVSPGWDAVVSHGDGFPCPVGHVVADIIDTANGGTGVVE